MADGSKMLPDDGISGNRNPDFRIDGKLADVKSTTNTRNGIAKAITDVNNQIKNSDFPTELGEAIIELSGDVSDFGDLNREVRRSFGDRGRSLDTVSIFDSDGNLLGRWVRGPDGTVTGP